MRIRIGPSPLDHCISSLSTQFLQFHMGKNRYDPVKRRGHAKSSDHNSSEPDQVPVVENLGLELTRLQNAGSTESNHSLGR